MRLNGPYPLGIVFMRRKESQHDALIILQTRQQLIKLLSTESTRWIIEVEHVVQPVVILAVYFELLVVVIGIHHANFVSLNRVLLVVRETTVHLLEYFVRKVLREKYCQWMLLPYSP